MSTKPLLTPALTTKLEGTLLRRYGPFLQGGERFRVMGSAIAVDAWTLNVIFESRDRTLHLPVELALVINENPRLRNDEAGDILIDFLDYFFDRYFREGREVTMPIDWALFPFGEYSVRARGWERNKRLEDMADRLLAGEAIE